jgi:hypothetical protein
MSHPEDCHFSYITKNEKKERKTLVCSSLFLFLILAKVHQTEKLKIKK